MKKFFLTIIAFMTSIFSCGKHSDDGRYSFYISPGNHKSYGEGLIPDKCPSGQYSIKFDVHFNEYADVFVPNNPQQINKTIGLKEGVIPNKNSVILGYSTYNDKFELWLFVNHQNSFEHIKIGEFETGNFIGQFELGMTKTSYYIDYNGIRYEIDRDNGDLPKRLTLVRPWFGGKEPNPDNNGTINIRIEMR